MEPWEMGVVEDKTEQVRAKVDPDPQRNIQLMKATFAHLVKKRDG